MYILSEGTICNRPDQMYGWPGITINKNGIIFVIASERKSHVCPYGRIVVSKSADGGNTWSGLSEIYNSLLDDRDASILTMEDNTLVASWFTSSLFCDNPLWSERAGEIGDSTKDKYTGSFMLTSPDSGLSWDKTPLRMPECGAYHIGPYQIGRAHV